MTGFSSIGEWAVGEFPDPPGTVRLPEATVILESEAPFVAGGGSVLHPGGLLSLSSSPPIMDVGAEVHVPAAVMSLSSGGVAVSGGGAVHPPAAAVGLSSSPPLVSGGGRVVLGSSGLVLSSDPPTIVRLAWVRLRSAMTRLNSDPPRLTPGGLVQAWMVERIVAGVSIGEVAIAEPGPSVIRDVTPSFRLDAGTPVISGGGTVALPGPAELVLTANVITPVNRRRVPTILAIAS